MEIAGQGINPVQLFAGGTCSTIIASTASHAAVQTGAKFDWSAVELPYEKGATPKNSVIGGGALWALTGHSDAQYQAVAAFFNYLASVETQVWWHKATGYVPVTKAAYETAKAEGYYKTNPTPRDRGDSAYAWHAVRTIRWVSEEGNSNQINVGIMEEMQAAMLGKKPVQTALDDAVARGNEILRRYEQLHAGKQ